MGTTVLIGLGSNVGDRGALLDSAVAALSATPGVSVRGVSRYRETAPVGGPAGQHPFLNAAAALETTLEPVALLDRLHQIEHDAGRVRKVRWAERTLDLDLLLFGDLVVETDRLRLPHPRLAFRRFVLAPLAEIAPEAVDPVTGRTVAASLANLDRRPSHLAFAPSPRRAENPLFEPVVRALGAVPIEGDDPDRRSKTGDEDRWLVSRSWIDARSRLPRPTFVVAAGSDLDRLPNDGSPVLRLEDFGSATALDEVLTACAATRTG